MLTQDFLVVMRAVLAVAIGMMNAALRWSSQRNRHVQCLEGQIAFHPVSDSPANDAPRMQVKDDSQVEPAFAGPHVADVARLPISDWANLREDHHSGLRRSCWIKLLSVESQRQNLQQPACAVDRWITLPAPLLRGIPWQVRVVRRSHRSFVMSCLPFLYHKLGPHGIMPIAED